MHSNLRSTLETAVDVVQSPSAGFLDFPSPASDLEVFTPGVDSLSLGSFDSRPPSDACSPLAISPVPGTVEHQQSVLSPTYEHEQPEFAFDTLVGARVAPTPMSLGPELRSPSFARLGIISAPHSEPICRPALARNPVLAYARAGAVNLEPDTKLPADPSAGEHVTEFSSIVQPSVPLHSPVHHYVTTLTPPDDNGRITWDSMTEFPTGHMISHATESGALMSGNESSSASTAGSAPPAINIQCSTPMEESSRPWLRNAIQIILKNTSSNAYQEPIKVLSHALPCPSTEGHAFPTIISSLHDETPTSPTCWINVFHALPGRFSLSDLPTSPPSTPGPPVGGDDYFTSKVFDSAVHILDYADNLKSLPKSPRPVVPPSSVDVSIVERYIPPTSKNEFADMFTTRGPSLLVDRMVELSPDNGTLIFVYPTKRGARTFMADYLGPIIDPILRSMIVINGFSSDMCQQLGRMDAVNDLLDHNDMKRQILQLCSSLSQSSPGMERFHKIATNFDLVLSSTEEVKLERKIWSDWWAKQEKARIREVVSRFFRKANRAQEDQTPVSLVHELLDGVSQKAYPEGRDDPPGIEVSVFVITRSRRAK